MFPFSLRARLPRHSLLYVGLLAACFNVQAQEAGTATDESSTRSDATELDAVQVKGERLGLNLNLDASSVRWAPSGYWIRRSR